MHKYMKAAVAAVIFAASFSIAPAHAQPNTGGTSSTSCCLGKASYPNGSVVGVLRCKNGKWVIDAKLPGPLGPLGT